MQRINKLTDRIDAALQKDAAIVATAQRLE
jgi:hypothetical protein